MKIYKRKDGRYSTQVKQPDGKYKTIYGKTKREVRDKYNKMVADFQTQPFVPSNNIGLSDYFSEWINRYTVDLSYSTVRGYKYTFSNYILPFFGNKPMQKITYGECQDFVNLLNEKIHPNSVMIYTNKLKRIFNDAVKQGLIAKSPMDGVIMPRIIQSPRSTLDITEISTFITTAKEVIPEDYDVFEFLLLTGIRVGELFGLTIDSYDPVKHTLTVDKQYKRSEQGFCFTPTKTHKSRVLLLSERAEYIVQDRIQQIQEVRNINPDHNPLNFLFIRKGGKRYTHSTLARRLNSICDLGGFSHLTIHDLRHTYATISLALGGDVKTIQNNLGHSSAIMTLDIYATSTKSMEMNLNNKIDGLWESFS